MLFYINVFYDKKLQLGARSKNQWTVVETVFCLCSLCYWSLKKCYFKDKSWPHSRGKHLIIFIVTRPAKCKFNPFHNNKNNFISFHILNCTVFIIISSCMNSDRLYEFDNVHMQIFHAYKIGNVLRKVFSFFHRKTICIMPTISFITN